jgi:hypothetical protein
MTSPKSWRPEGWQYVSQKRGNAAFYYFGFRSMPYLWLSSPSRCGQPRRGIFMLASVSQRAASLTLSDPVGP